MQKASAFAAAAFVLSSAVLLAQHPTVQVSSGRKITSQIAPAYPDIAKRMHMHGTVRLEVVVGFNGSVKSSVILGGSPVLAEAASAAVSKWRFEPEPSETKEVIQFVFQTE